MKFKYILSLSLLGTLCAGKSQAANFKSYVFPPADLVKDPVTGKSPNLNLPRPATFDSDMALAVASGEAVSLNPNEHGCNWATTNEVYAFRDGAIYTDRGTNTYHIFPRDTVLKSACWLPRVPTSGEFLYPVAPGTSVKISEGAAKANDPIRKVPNFAEFGYTTAIQDNAASLPEVAITDRSKFQDDMSQGIQLTQRQHGCAAFLKKPFITDRPFIYVFSDAVVYARTDTAAYTAVSRRLVEEKGCVLPNTAYAPARKPIPAEDFTKFGFTENPFLRETTPAKPATMSHLDDDHSKKICNGTWSWDNRVPYLDFIPSRGAPKGTPSIRWEGETTVSYPGLNPSKRIVLDNFKTVEVMVQRKKSENLRGMSQEASEKALELCKENAVFMVPVIYAFPPKQVMRINGEDKAFDAAWDAARVLQGYTSDPGKSTADIYRKLRSRNYYDVLSKDVSIPGTMSDIQKREMESSGYTYLANKMFRLLGNYESFDHQQPFNDEIRVFLGEVASKETENGVRKLTYYYKIPCSASIQPRYLTPVPQPMVIPGVGEDLNYTYKIAFIESKGSSPAQGKTRAEILLQNPLRYLELKAPEANPTDDLAKAYASFYSKKDEASRYEVRPDESFVCSSGDHLPSIKLDEKGAVVKAVTKDYVQTKYNFLRQNIIDYMSNNSLIDYVKKGYCQSLDKDCTFDKSPDLAAMLRNFQALRNEKRDHLLLIDNGFPLETINQFYEISKNVVYPEYKVAE